MKNSRIVRAYDSINPSPAEKAKILDAILAEANLEEKPVRQRKKKEPVVYTARPTKVSKRSTVMTIVASIIMLLISGFVLTHMLRQPDNISYNEPVNLGTPYDAVLSKYKTALEEGWSAEQCNTEDIFEVTIINYSALDVGYAIVDLDNNGIEEMILSNGESQVYELYSMNEDGDPVQLYRKGPDFSVFRILEGGTLVSESFENSGRVYAYYMMNGCIALTDPDGRMWQENGQWYLERAGEDSHVLTDEVAKNTLAEQKYMKLDQTSLLTLVSEAVAEKYRYGDNNKYAAIIAKYNQAITEGWTKEHCEIEGISTRMEAGGDFTKAGYAFQDLDGDGREELIIAEESTERTDNIWDLYTTLEDGTPIQLWVDERDGGQCKLCEDNVISISDAYNDELEQTFYDLQAGQLVMREMLQWEDEDTVFHTDASGNTRQVTYREGQNISYGYETQKLELAWLADMPDELRNAEPTEQYLLVLEKYRTALREKWDMQLCSDNDISLMISHFVEDPDRIGAHPLDLDGDGTMELIITDGMMIYDLYTLKDGSPVHLITGWERNSYQLCLDNIIYNRGSNGAASSVNNYYQLRDGELVLVESVVFDANKDFDNPWFRSTDGETPEEPLTENEANAIMDSYPTISFLGIDLLETQ